MLATFESFLGHRAVSDLPRIGAVQIHAVLDRPIQRPNKYAVPEVTYFNELYPPPRRSLDYAASESEWHGTAASSLGCP